ncbi:MAG: hypothetical protein HUK40_13680 [Desulfobacter sp.]|nr:hypothetical protein [Desulfobacter sp.]
MEHIGWNQIPGLLKALGLAPERVYELLDFYHAVEHLGTVAGLRKTWSSKERKRWVSKQRGLLLKEERLRWYRPSRSFVEAETVRLSRRNGIILCAMN